MRTLALLLLIALNAQAQFKNIRLTIPAEGKSSPVEPAVVINTANPLNMVAAAGKDRIIFSRDGGEIWLETTVKSSAGVIGDMVLTNDAKGNIYLAHLADATGEGKTAPGWLDRIVVQKSIDGGAFWNDGYFTGLNPPKDNDKPWLVSHPKKDLLALTWTQFDQYGSKESGCQSNILFSRSTNKTEKWSDPVRINKINGDCQDSDQTAMGAIPFVDNDGRIFVTWAHNGIIYLDRSFDNGETWLRSDISVARQMGGWDIQVPGLSRCNGLPFLAGDNSTSPFRGSLYLLFADQRFGETDTDIWFTKSPNRGDNWSDPVRVNADTPGHHQFLPSMTVDPATGIVYVVYYDRRQYPSGDVQTDVYLAWSEDGGNHFSETRISETPFSPTPLSFFGDYTGISAFQGKVIPVWTRMDNGQTSIWTTVINHQQLKGGK